MELRYTGSNFKVFIKPIELRGNFSSVSGLDAQLEFDEYNEGGNFTSPIYLPKGMRYSNIVLQRGTVSLEPLSDWFSAVQMGVHLRFPMEVTMMNSSGFPVKYWWVMDTMPVKVDYSPLDALSGSVSITTIEMTHGEILSII